MSWQVQWITCLCFFLFVFSFCFLNLCPYLRLVLRYWSASNFSSHQYPFQAKVDSGSFLEDEIHHVWRAWESEIKWWRPACHPLISPHHPTPLFFTHTHTTFFKYFLHEIEFRSGQRMALVDQVKSGDQHRSHSSKKYASTFKQETQVCGMLYDTWP